MIAILKSSTVLDIDVTEEKVHPKTLHYRGHSAVINLDPNWFAGNYRRRVYKDSNWHNGGLFIIDNGDRVLLSLPLEKEVYRTIDKESKRAGGKESDSNGW